MAEPDRVDVEVVLLLRPVRRGLERGFGWVARVPGRREEGDEPAVAFYCPGCAEREFGRASRPHAPRPT